MSVYTASRTALRIPFAAAARLHGARDGTSRPVNNGGLLLRFLRRARPVWVVLLAVSILAAHPGWAIEIWNGPSINFTNAIGSDPTLPANQDRLTLNVWLTRGYTKGLYNAAVETSYSSLSPVGTEWAYGALADYASLNYQPWLAWYAKNPSFMVTHDAVLHLIPDDTFLAIRFTFWNERAGGFSYTRSSPPVPEPSPVPMILAGMATAAGVRLRRRLRRGCAGSLASPP